MLEFSMIIDSEILEVTSFLACRSIRKPATWRPIVHPWAEPLCVSCLQGSPLWRFRSRFNGGGSTRFHCHNPGEMKRRPAVFICLLMIPVACVLPHSVSAQEVEPFFARTQIINSLKEAFKLLKDGNLILALFGLLKFAGGVCAIIAAGIWMASNIRERFPLGAVASGVGGIWTGHQWFGWPMETRSIERPGRFPWSPRESIEITGFSMGAMVGTFVFCVVAILAASLIAKSISWHNGDSHR